MNNNTTNLDQYTLTIGGEEEYLVEANFAEASSPILLDGRGTPFQVADAQHIPEVAAKILYGWLQSEGALQGFDGEPDYEIEPADEDEAGENDKPTGPRVWVANQPEGIGFDGTASYLTEAGIVHVNDREQGCILPCKFRFEWENRVKAAAAAVAAIGHGDEECDEEIDEPRLEWIDGEDS